MYTGQRSDVSPTRIPVVVYRGYMKRIAPLLALALWTAPALAAPIRFDDRAGVLTDADKAAIPEQKYPLIILTENDPVGGPALLQRARESVAGPQYVVLAVDPEHRKVYARFGFDTGVREKDYDAITAAGNAFFKEKKYAAGFQAMVERTNKSVAAGDASTVAMSPESATLLYGTFGVGLLAAVIAFYVLWRSRKAKAEWQAKEDALDAELAASRKERMAREARNVEEEGWHRDMKTRVADKTPTPAPDRVGTWGGRTASGGLSNNNPPRGYDPTPAPSYSPAPSNTNVNVVAINNSPTYVAPPQPTYIAPREEPAPYYPPQPTYVAPSPAPSYGGGSSSSYGGGGSSDSGSGSSWGGGSSSYDSGGSSSSYDSGSSSSYDSSSSGGGSSDF